MIAQIVGLRATLEKNPACGNRAAICEVQHQRIDANVSVDVQRIRRSLEAEAQIAAKIQPSLVGPGDVHRQRRTRSTDRILNDPIGGSEQIADCFQPGEGELRDSIHEQAAVLQAGQRVLQGGRRPSFQDELILPAAGLPVTVELDGPVGAGISVGDIDRHRVGVARPFDDQVGHAVEVRQNRDLAVDRHFQQPVVDSDQISIGQAVIGRVLLRIVVGRDRQ